MLKHSSKMPNLFLFNPNMSFATESVNFRVQWYLSLKKVDYQGIPPNAGIFEPTQESVSFPKHTCLMT